MKNRLKNKWIVVVLVLIVGIFIGKMMGGGASSEIATDEHNHAAEGAAAEATIWTCSMHPQIQKDEPGQCPLCGMDLIPLDTGGGSDEDALPDEVPMSPSAMKLAEVQTFIVKKQKPEKEIRLLGKVKADERLEYSQVIHFPGRIEKLYINFTGEKVYKGQKLATVYSPELITAQKELFEVLKDENTSPSLVAAAREKLHQWKFTDKQIEAIEKSGKVQTEIDVLSDYTGYVMMRMISEGDHVMEGQVLFEITDLSKIWVLFEAYENDLPWIKLKDKIDIELKSIPGKFFEGKVTFIDPFINPKTRVAYVRVELPNKGGQFKPDMFANGIVTSELPIDEDVILVPKSAVLWTGKRAVVYIKLPNRDHNSFLYREVILGEDAGEYYIIKQGLEEGEEIASNGVFKIDASAQLLSKKSMMNPTGGKVSTGGMSGMDMGGDDKKEMDMSKMDMEKEVMIDKSKVPAKFKKQLGTVVASYLVLKDKLVTDDNNLQQSIKGIRIALKKVDMSLVMEDVHNEWMKDMNLISKNLNFLEKAINIDEQRNIFLPISKALKEATQKLGVKMKNDAPLYLDFCPMADNKKGGYWLSTDKNIKNPYYGSKMSKCGEVKETVTK